MITQIEFLRYALLLLDLKLILLIRDPRGVYQSRLHRVWCPGHSDCDQPDVLCNDMLSDADAYRRLSTEYPDKIR